MDADQGREMVEGNYVKLSEALDIVESKYDLYPMHLTDEELEVAELDYRVAGPFCRSDSA